MTPYRDPGEMPEEPAVRGHLFIFGRGLKRVGKVVGCIASGVSVSYLAGRVVVWAFFPTTTNFWGYISLGSCTILAMGIVTQAIYAAGRPE